MNTFVLKLKQMAHVTARIPDDVYATLKKIADDQNRSFNQIAGFALKEYADKHSVKYVSPRQKAANARKLQK
jgi:predicted transcriptional regulator